MIRVTVELVPGGVGEPVELGRAEIWNDLEDYVATDGRRGSYGWRIHGRRGRCLRSSAPRTRVRGYSRSKIVWYLLAEVLEKAGYGCG